MKKAIISTVKNFELYKKTATTFPKGYDKIVVDGSKGLYGLESLIFIFDELEKYKYEWIILVDADCVFLNNSSLDDIISFMNE